jgi:hypothetical protein
MLKLLTSVILACAVLFAGATASAQILHPPPPGGGISPPLWTGGFAEPNDSCLAQHAEWNPGATYVPATYGGPRVTHCHWLLDNPDANTVLPADVYTYCLPGWQFSDAGICYGTNPASLGRMLACCGDQSPAASPSLSKGDPVELNYAAESDYQIDYASADGRFAVERNYYSLGADYTNVSSPTAVAGFGARWHGTVPGRLAVSGQYAEKIEYLDTHGGFSIFNSDDARALSVWTWHTATGNRRRLSMVNVSSTDRTDYFYTQSAALNGAAEVRMDKSKGEYILFRRSGASAIEGIRYLVPIEHGYADGYKLYYTYPDTGEFPSTVSDSLGRQMALTWVDAPPISL